MDILLLTGRFPERSETFIYRHAMSLARRKHRVTVMAREIGDWTLFPDPRPAELRVVKLPADDTLGKPGRAASAIAGAVRALARSPAEARHVWSLCVAREPVPERAIRLFLRHLAFAGLSADVVHCEFLNVATMYPLVGEVIGAPVVVSCRGSDIHMLELRSDDQQRASLTALRRADALHCVCTELATEVSRLVGRTEDVWVNRPAVDIDAIVERDSLHTNARFRLLATGRLDWKKGFDYLLDALALLVRRGVELELEIIGDGELRSSIRYSIQDLGLQRYVTLAGAMSSAEVLAKMKLADAFVLSSVAEGISNAVLEAMATGLPIVTTNAGGMAEAVTDGIEGFVVPVRDTVSLADRIERLARDAELRRRMGSAARHRAVSEFSITRQVEVFEAMYRSVSGREDADRMARCSRERSRA